MFERANHNFQKKEMVVSMALKKDVKFQNYEMMKAKEEEIILS